MSGINSNQLNDLIAISQAILEAAEADDWQQAVDLEVKRRPEMEKFSTSLKLEEVLRIAPAELRKSIERLIQIDQRVAALGQVAKDEVASKSSGMNTARQAASAYETNKSL